VLIFAPFIYCTFGGFLYDSFIYTGTSSINTRWMGLKRLVGPNQAKKINARFASVDITYQ
jgi:aquaglyceroporin related protein